MSRKPNPPRTFAAVITMDPAGVGPSGIAARSTASLVNAKRGKIRYPDFAYQGNAFEPRMHDELAVWLAQNTPSGARVLLVVEDSVYRSYTIARHIGRGIGAVESVLADLGYSSPAWTQYVTPKVWRGHQLPAVDGGREEWKQAAIDCTATLYGENVEGDLAEAVMLNDYVIIERKAWWRDGKIKVNERAEIALPEAA